MNVVSGAPCTECGHDGRADIIDRWFEGPTPVGMILLCSFCNQPFLWMLDIPATWEAS